MAQFLNNSSISLFLQTIPAFGEYPKDGVLHTMSKNGYPSGLFVLYKISVALATYLLKHIQIFMGSMVSNIQACNWSDSCKSILVESVPETL